MCGITGYSGQYDAALLERMNAVIAHRGPDDAGMWTSSADAVGLAQRRLTILDLSERGRQPMWDSTRTVAIVFNGEIYNFRELCSTLQSQGYRFNSGSDTEVLLNLYLRDGTEMLAELNGIFAFAMWDTRSRSLFIARDGVGVKPLYYTETRTGFLFGSEIKSILEAPDVDRDLNPEAILYYLTFLYSPAPDTMFRSIKKLKPGHAMTVRSGRIERQWEFYDLPYTQPIADINEQDAIEEVRKTVRTAVQRQMVADVPVGAFLSGGLDSSSVVAFAREHVSAGRLQCFTIDFKGASMAEEGIPDDLPYARRVAKHLNVDLHTITVGTDFFSHIEKAIFHLEEPQGDPAAINTFFISSLAKHNGIKVLLSGTGGDDIFTGYRRHVALTRERFWAWLPGVARRQLAAAAAFVPNGPAWGRRVNKAFRNAGLEGDERIASYFHWIDPNLLPSIYGERLRDVSPTFSASRPMLEALKKLPDTVLPLNRMLYLDGKFFLPDHNLNYTDKMGMAAGVEIRVPLLDPDLVQLAARLPVELKQRGSVGKWIFKRSMEGILPDEVIYRPKTGFAVPIRRWLRNELRPLVEDTLSRDSLLRHGLFDPDGLMDLMKRDRAGTLDGSYTILAVVFIELWQRIFVDQCSSFHAPPCPAVAVS